MDYIWPFLSNPILNCTDGSYRKALNVSIHHYNAISNSTIQFIIDMFVIYGPLHLAFVAAYNEWIAQGGAQEGETLTVNQLLRLVSKKIKTWDIAIQGKYPDDTARYKALLPNRREPFQKGAQDLRIGAISSLSTNIGADPLLATVKTDVDLTFTQIQTAFNHQKHSITETSLSSDAVETARVAMCVGQYADLGTFITKYASHPLDIAPYFDIESIRRHEQVLFDGHVNPLETKFLRKHTFGLLDEISIWNKGTGVLKFFVTELKGGALGSTCVTVQPASKYVGLASAMGSLTKKIIMVHNPDPNLKGDYEFEFL